MELKSLKKKYKGKGFAAGCSREVIQRGAEQLGWDLETADHDFAGNGRKRRHNQRRDGSRERVTVKK